MKAKRVKSLIALLLVVAMMLPTTPFSFADSTPKPKMLDKKIIGDPDAQGYYTIELSVEDTGEPQTHDVVIAFDVSYSMMDNDKIGKAKQAAIAFAEKLLEGNLSKYNRIAIVSFADDVHFKQDFTNDITSIRNAINGLKLFNRTHIQAGLHQARLYLAKSKANHKQILLLSDGEPTASYDLKKDTNNYYNEADFMPLTNPGPDEDDPKYESKDERPVQNMNYSKTVYVIEGYNSHIGKLKKSDLSVVPVQINFANQAYSEAKMLKDAGVTIRVVAYDLKPKFQAILKKIASENAFYVAGVDQILDILSNIAENFAKYTNVVVTDPIGDLFNLHPTENPIAQSFNGLNPTTVQVSPDRRVITWKVGNLKGKGTLTYKVKLKPEYEGMENTNPDGMYTNGDASFGYGGGSLAFPKPQVPINRVVYHSELPTSFTKAYNYLIKQERDVKGITEISMPSQPVGKIFVGWREADGTMYQPKQKLQLGRSYDFTAVWKNDPNVFADVTGKGVGEGTVQPGPAVVEYGKTTFGEIKNTFNATPAPGYKIEKWYIEKNGSPAGDITDAYKFKKSDGVVPGNIIVVAKFVKDAAKWVEISAGVKPNANGTVTGGPISVLKDSKWSEVPKAEKDKFKTKPNPGYKFDKWVLENGSPVTDDTPFNANTKIYATFVKDNDQYATVTALPNNAEFGTVSGSVEVIKNTDTWGKIKGTFNPQHKPGYRFTNKWTLQDGTVLKDTDTFAANTNVYAVFEKNAAVWFDIKAEAKENGKVTGGPVNVAPNTPWSSIKAKFTPKADTGYKFSKWTMKNGAEYVDVLDTTVFTKATTVYANFVKDDDQWVYVSGNSKGNGTISGGPALLLKGKKWSDIPSNTFTTKPDTGYIFDKWTLADGSEVTPDTVFNESTIVYANFVKNNTEWVIVTADTKGNGAVSGGPAELLKGKKWKDIPANTFKTTPDPGYNFDKWVLGDNSPVTNDTVFNVNTTVYATFKKDNTKWVTVSADTKGNGTVTGGPKEILKGKKWKDIPEDTFTTKPSPGFKFDKWTLNDGTPVTPDTVFNANTVVYANFVKDNDQYILVSGSTKANGTVTGGPAELLKGKKWSDIPANTFTATPDSGYKFDKWVLDDNSPVTNDTVFNVNTTVYAVFIKDDAKWVTVSADTKGNGTVTGGPKEILKGKKWKDIPEDTFTTKPSPGFKFDKWTLNDGTPVTPDTVFNTDTVVYANFVKDDGQYTTINAAVYNNIGGSVSPASVEVLKTDTYAAAIAKITVTKQAGYVFQHWVDAAGTAIKTDEVVKPNDTVYAKFLKDTGEFINITGLSNGNGTVTGGPANVVKGTKWSEIKATFGTQPEAGFTFLKWTLEDGTDVTPDTVFNTDAKVFANFVKDAGKYIRVNAKVYLDEGGKVTPESAEILKGLTYGKLGTKFTPKADPGYAFIGWVDVNGKPLDPAVEIKDGDIVYAMFSKLHGQWIKLTAKAVGEGEIKPDEEAILLKDPVTGKSQLAWAAIKEHEFTPDPKPGYKHIKWTLDMEGTVEVPDDKTFDNGDVVYAIFVLDDDQHMNVLAEAEPAIGGTATPSLRNILKGTKWSEIRHEYNAIPNAGYTFEGWFVKETGQPLPKLGDDETLIPDFVFNAPEIVLQAKFKEDSDKWITVTAKSNGNGLAIGGPAKVLKGSTWEQIDKHFTVKPNPGYRFVNWTDNKGKPLTDAYVFNVTQEIYANFAAIPPSTPPKPKDKDEYQEYNPGNDGNTGGTTGGNTGDTTGGNTGGNTGGTTGPVDDSTTINEEDVAKGILNYNDFYAYIQGYPDGSVRSSAYVNREETAAIFFRLLEPTYKESIRSVKNNFKDITTATWSNKHISTLANGGIIRGYSDGTFRPRAAITRAELAVIAAKFDRVNNNNAHNFKDVKGHWAEKYIANASTKGWIKGYPNGEFRPDTPITRAEFVTFVNKVLGRNVKKSEIPQGVRRFTDLKPDAWFYENMVTATNSYLASRGDDGFQKWSKLVNMFIEM